MNIYLEWERSHNKSQIKKKKQTIPQTLKYPEKEPIILIN
jgi:hypothetical protein